MSKLHLITGYMGEEHIQSADQGSFNASFFGSGEYVMEAGNQFEASIMDNNTVRILDGDALMKGRHLRIEPKTYADVTIETGTAGVNRNDLIVFQYSKDTATGIESSDIVVIKGAEASGTATDPTYTDGDILGGATFNQMPMYRVKVEGVVLTAIEPLFTVIPTYKTLAEQYAQQYEDTIHKLKTDNILDTMEEVEANTQEGQIAGALALKEFDTTRNLKTYTNVTQLGLTLDNTLDDIFNAMPLHSQLVTIISQGKSLGGTLPNTNTAELTVTKSNDERATALLMQYQNGVVRKNNCYSGVWQGWEAIISQSELDEITAVRNVQTYSSLEQLGLSFDNTIKEVMRALPINSELIQHTSATENNFTANLPNGAEAGEVRFCKGGANQRGFVEFKSYSYDRVYVNRFYDNVFKGWRKLIEPSDLTDFIKTMEVTGPSTTIGAEGSSTMAKTVNFTYTVPSGYQAIGVAGFHTGNTEVYAISATTKRMDLRNKNTVSVTVTPTLTVLLAKIF